MANFEVDGSLAGLRIGRPAARPFGRVVVTGAAGFIGFHVAARLLDSGIEVLGLDDLNPYYDPALKRLRLARLAGRPGFSFEERDVADHEGVLATFRAFRPDAVVHLAAQAGVRHSVTHPRPYARSNLDGFLSILEASRALEVAHLAYASSSSVYGGNTKVPFHEDDPVERPLSLYAATKRANEMMAESYAHLYAIPMSGLRFFSVYGPWGRPDMAYWSFTQAIAEGRPIQLFNEGRMSRDFTYVDDVAEAVCRLAQRPPQADPEAGAPRRAPHVLYNIGHHEPTSLASFVSEIEAALGQSAERRYAPMQPGDVETTFADVSRLRAAIGYVPPTPLREGIRRFVAWYSAYRDGRLADLPDEGHGAPPVARAR